MSALTWQKLDGYINTHTEEIVSPELVETPLVTVIIQSYQHEAFIGQAVEGALMQNTDFPFEIVIGDDCSHDGTFEILKRHQQENPRLIRLFRTTPRLGLEGGYGLVTFIRSLRASRGKYVAIVEGDDYWTDPSKLQTQAMLLEANPDCGGSYHDVEIVGDWKGERIFEDYGDKDRITFDDQNVFDTPLALGSLMFRKDLFDSLPDFYLDAPFLDRFYIAQTAACGPILRARGKMGAYRRHEGGLTNNPMMQSFDAWFRAWKLWRETKRHFAPRGSEFFDYMARFSFRFMLRKCRRPNWNPQHLARTMAAARQMGVSQTLLAFREMMGKPNRYARKW